MKLRSSRIEAWSESIAASTRPSASSGDGTMISGTSSSESDTA